MIYNQKLLSVGICAVPLLLAALVHGPFGEGRYTLIVFAERFIGEFENVGFLLHLGGSVNPVPIPAAAWLFGSGLLGLLGVVKRKVG